MIKYVIHVPLEDGMGTLEESEHQVQKHPIRKEIPGDPSTSQPIQTNCRLLERRYRYSKIMSVIVLG